DPIVDTRPVAAPVPSIDDPFIHISARDAYIFTMCLFTASCDDIDDTVDRVRSPDCPARTADHFNSFHIRQHEVLYFPVRPREQCCVYGSPINENQDITCQPAAETPDPDCPPITVDASNFHAGHQSERLRHIGCSRPANVIACQHEDGR